MPFDVEIQITPDKIEILLPATGETELLANRAAYDPVRLALATVGKTEAELKNQLGDEWLSRRGKLAWTRLFDPETKGPIFDYKAMDFLLGLARKRLPPRPGASWLPGLAPAIDLDLAIQRYDRLSLGRQRELEYYLQDFLRVRRLQINQQDRTIAPGLRTLQAAGNLTLRVLLPALAVYAGLYGLTRSLDQGLWIVVGFVLAGLAGGAVAYLLGSLAWLALFRGRLPHGYLRYQLRSGPKFLRSISRWAANQLLD